jgi:Zn-dependent protease with chaperone function
MPEIYVVEGSEINAFAVRVGARNSVLLVDDLIWGSIDAGLTDALRFIVAHELAHHALGHLGTFRYMLKTSMPRLARLDELSADAVALQLVGTREAAYEGIMLLTVGPQLMKYTNRQEILRQASLVAGDKASLKAERPLTHPLTLRRLHVLRETRLG